MNDHPEPPDPGAAKPGPEDTTRRDSEAMLRGKPPQDPLIGTTVDQYSIKRVIGEGGMGVVYEALQQSPRRTVALKMMKRGVTSKSAMRRFEYEAQTLGRLRHDGIAQIYQAGTWDDGTGGRPWFAMEYIQGAKTLTQYCKDKKLGTRERLDIFSKVCAAVQHGHAKGIIHRDLKPGNILVTSSGVPKVIDFGVARSTDSDMAVTTLQTDVGALIGTLQYMSPEQCDADPNDIDIRSDVYAMGVVLYELLCDQLPYALRHAAIHEAARIIREEEPTKPSSLDKRLRGDIETITLKALEKDRDRRYQSATALEEDIDRYLAGDPIAAKAPSAIDYLKRFARKHKAAAISIAAIFVVLVGAVIAISIFAVRAKQAELGKTYLLQNMKEMNSELESTFRDLNSARQETEEHLATVQSQITEIVWSSYVANIHSTLAAIEWEDVPTAQSRLDEAKQAMASTASEKMPFEWRHLSARSDDAIRTTILDEGVATPTFSPDRRRVAASLRHPEGEEGEIRPSLGIWNVETGERLVTVTDDSDYNWALAWSPDGTKLIGDAGRHTLRIWDTQTGEELTSWHAHDGLINDIAYSPDGVRVASASHDTDMTTRIWDSRTGEKLAELNSPAESLEFSPDGMTLALSSSYTSRSVLWNIEDDTTISLGAGGEGLDFSPDGTRLAHSDRSGRINIYDTSTGQEVLSMQVPYGKSVNAVRFTPDGARLASVGGDRPIRIWDAQSGEQLDVLLGHTNQHEYHSLEFSQDGSKLFTAEDQGDRVHTWLVPEKNPSGFTESQQGSMDFTFSPDGSQFATVASPDATIRIWDPSTQELLATIGNVDNNGQSNLAYSPDGLLLACARWNESTLRIWSTQTGLEVAAWKTDTNAGPEGSRDIRGGSTNRGLTFGPDGKRLYVPSGEVTRVWNIASGEELPPLTSDYVGGAGGDAAFSREGNLLACGTFRVDVIDVTSGETVCKLPIHTAVDDIDFSPDARLLATCSSDLRIWDIQTGARLHIINIADFPQSVEFSPDGTRIVAPHGNFVRLFDSHTGKEVAVLRGHRDSVFKATFSPDGNRLVSGQADGTIRIWETRSRGLVAQASQQESQRATELSPVVEAWMERTGGDSELVVAMLERELKNRPVEEQATLRNLVLKAFQSQRDEVFLRHRIEAFPARVKRVWDRPDSLNWLAWRTAISDDKAFFNAVSDDVLRAAQRACELTDYENAMYLDTLARVHFERGELAEAIKWQELAMQHISEGDEKGAYQRSLDRYLGAAQLDVATPAEP